MISIINIPQLQDNYSYIILNQNQIIVIDPADSKSILKYIYENKLSLKAILLTHHHKDHTAGVEGIISKINVPVYSPNKEIKNTSKLIKDQDIIDLNFIKFKVIETPGHTKDHVVFYCSEKNILFSGDTLFRLGCGRVFEGSYKEMYISLKKIFALNNKTNVYCGHEYTLNNLKFLLSVFPKSKDLLFESNEIIQQIKATGSSIPFNLGREKHINPFLGSESLVLSQYKNQHNLSNFDLFSNLRDLKNEF